MTCCLACKAGSARSALGLAHTFPTPHNLTRTYFLRVPSLHLHGNVISIACGLQTPRQAGACEDCMLRLCASGPCEFSATARSALCSSSACDFGMCYVSGCWSCGGRRRGGAHEKQRLCAGREKLILLIFLIVDLTNKTKKKFQLWSRNQQRKRQSERGRGLTTTTGAISGCVFKSKLIDEHLIYKLIII